MGNLGIPKEPRKEWLKPDPKANMDDIKETEFDLLYQDIVDLILNGHLAQAKAKLQARERMARVEEVKAMEECVDDFQGYAKERIKEIEGGKT